MPLALTSSAQSPSAYDYDLIDSTTDGGHSPRKNPANMCGTHSDTSGKTFFFDMDFTFDLGVEMHSHAGPYRNSLIVSNNISRKDKSIISFDLC